MTLGALVPWPTGDDLVAWMAKRGQTGVEYDETLVAAVVEEVSELVAVRCGLEFVDAEDEPTLISKVQRRAIIRQAHRAWVRRDNPEGIIGIGETGVRVSRLDPDIEDMLTPSTVIHIGHP